MKIKISFILLSVLSISLGSPCNEEPFCATFDRKSLVNFCATFLKIPCPHTCGKCAADSLRDKFLPKFDVNGDGKILVDEAQKAINTLKINPDDALITEIKDLVFDSKRLLTDLYSFLDANKNSKLTLTEVLHGSMKLFDNFGVHIKPKFALIVGYISEIIRVFAPQDILVPNIGEIVDKMTKELQSFPHGMTALSKLQNLSRTGMDFERLIKTQGFSYSIDVRLLTWGVLRYMDKNLDMHVSPHEFANAIIEKLSFFGFKIDSELSNNLDAFEDMMVKSNHVLLEKYGVIDAAQLDGRVLPDLGNKSFNDERIYIGLAVKNNTRVFNSTDVMKYVKTATNALPQRKLTENSVIEATFFAYDKNKDYTLDLMEFSELAIVALGRIDAGLKDFSEAQRVFQLSDLNKNEKLSKTEFLRLLQSSLNSNKLL